jgi:hypothetical protein
MKSPDQINQATPITVPMFLYLPTQFYAHVDGNIIPVQPVDTSPKVPFMAGTCEFMDKFQTKVFISLLFYSKKKGGGFSSLHYK